jgi:hypothetical protein
MTGQEAVSSDVVVGKALGGLQMQQQELAGLAWL